MCKNSVYRTISIVRAIKYFSIGSPRDRLKTYGIASPKIARHKLFLHIQMYMMTPRKIPQITDCQRMPVPQLWTTGLTLKALHYLCINHGFFQFKIIINVLVIALPDSFKYLCYGSTAIRNIFTLTVRGSTLDVTICNLQTVYSQSDSDD